MADDEKLGSEDEEKSASSASGQSRPWLDLHVKGLRPEEEAWYVSGYKLRKVFGWEPHDLFRILKNSDFRGIVRPVYDAELVVDEEHGEEIAYDLDSVLFDSVQVCRAIERCPELFPEWVTKPELRFVLEPDISVIPESVIDEIDPAGIVAESIPSEIPQELRGDESDAKVDRYKEFEKWKKAIQSKAETIYDESPELFKKNIKTVRTDIFEHPEIQALFKRAPLMTDGSGRVREPPSLKAFRDNWLAKYRDQGKMQFGRGPKPGFKKDQPPRT